MRRVKEFAWKEFSFEILRSFFLMSPIFNERLELLFKYKRKRGKQEVNTMFLGHQFFDFHKSHRLLHIANTETSSASFDPPATCMKKDRK